MLIQQGAAREVAMRKFVFSTFVISFLGFSGSAWAIAPYLGNLCQDPNYTCIKVHKGETWQSLFADPELRNTVMHLNRINVQPKPGQQIVVPNDLANVKLIDLAPFEQQVQPTGKKTIVFVPGIQAWAAYDANGQLVRWGAASGGRDWCHTIGRPCQTKAGEFTVLRKQGPKCKSSKYPLPNGGAPMPYCMHFHGGYAIHASNEVPGYNASHGCVRIFLEDARWLNQEFVELPHEGETKVIIYDYPQSSKT